MQPTRNRAVSACYEAAEQPKTVDVASQPASHRRRPLEVVITIADGANKYRLNGREVKYPTRERITTILPLHGEHSGMASLLKAFRKNPLSL